VRFTDCNRVAFGALVRSPWRTFMMLIATSIGVAAILILTSLGEAARRYVTNEFESLGTNLIIVLPGKSETSGGGMMAMMGESPRDLTLQDAQAVARSPAIGLLAPVIVGSASVSHGGLERELTVLGTTAEFQNIRKWTMAAGEFLPNVGMDRSAPVCVIGMTVREELFPGTRPIGKWLRMGERRCRVTGVLAEQGTSVMIDVDEVVIVPVISAQAIFDSPGLFRIIIEARTRDTIEAAKRDTLNIITRRHYGEEDVTIITQDAVASTFDGIFSALTAALAGIASVSLIVAGVLIMNIMLVAVSQRTSEIGLYMALGAKQRQIIALFLTEAVFLSFFGAVVGAVLGFIAVAGLRYTYPSLDFVPPMWAVAGAFLVALVCGIVFGILPARRAARLDPIAALAGHA